MSVFHRVEDIYTMEAALFFRRVVCLPAYDGALARQYERQRDSVASVVSAHQAAPADTEEAAWAAHRAKAYSRFLAPGETATVVSANEALSLAASMTGGS